MYVCAFHNIHVMDDDRLSVKPSVSPFRLRQSTKIHFTSPYPAEHRQPDCASTALTARIAEFIDNVGFNGINIRSLRNSRN